MKYDFDKIIDRNNTDCLKHDFTLQRFGRADILPMWVADMDFETPDFITKAMQKRLDHPIYGYTMPPDSLYNSIINWISDMHGWQIHKKWMTFCTGVVPALHFCVKAYTNPGDKVIVQPPVYYPFFSAIEDNDRVVQNNPLKLVNGQFEMDFDDLEKNTDEKTKLIFLCSPHNPGGKVWSKETLEKLANFCIERNIIIISDEVHADMVYQPSEHIPLATLSKEISQNTVTLMAPTKTFNLAGLTISFAISENKNLLAKLNNYLNKTNVNIMNVFALAATEAAYTYGKPWLSELMEYLKSNLNFLKEYINQEIPVIDVIEPEATYLAWLDFNKVNIENKKIKKYLVEDAGIGLNDGITFGIGGDGFHRLNFACPKEILEQGLTKLCKSLKKLE